MVPGFRLLGVDDEAYRDGGEDPRDPGLAGQRAVHRPGTARDAGRRGDYDEPPPGDRWAGGSAAATPRLGGAGPAHRDDCRPEPAVAGELRAWADAPGG